METTPILFCFDYLDPISYLLYLELTALSEEGSAPPLRRHPLELRTPPEELLDPDGPEWTDRWEEARRQAETMGVPLKPPPLIPWTRKAHELVLHAQAKGTGDAAHAAVFAAVFRDGKDVGRVDVLVALAQELGLDPTETKAVLDVDRYTHDVVTLRSDALDAGARVAPTLVSASGILQGFHNRDALRTFLLR